MSEEQEQILLEGVKAAQAAAFMSPQHAEWADTLSAAASGLGLVVDRPGRISVPLLSGSWFVVDRNRSASHPYLVLLRNDPERLAVGVSGEQLEQIADACMKMGGWSKEKP